MTICNKHKPLGHHNGKNGETNYLGPLGGRGLITGLQWEEDGKEDHRDLLCICIVTRQPTLLYIIMYRDTRNSENLTHFFFENIQMVTLEHHKAISPDFSENAFATELPDPAHLVWL